MICARWLCTRLLPPTCGSLGLLRLCGRNVCGLPTELGAGHRAGGQVGSRSIADSLFCPVIPPPLHVRPAPAWPACSRSPTEGLSPLGFCTLWPCDSAVAFPAPPLPWPLGFGRCEILIASLGTGLFLSVVSDQNIILSCKYNYRGGGSGRGGAQGRERECLWEGC